MRLGITLGAAAIAATSIVSSASAVDLAFNNLYGVTGFSVDLAGSDISGTLAAGRLDYTVTGDTDPYFAVGQQISSFCSEIDQGVTGMAVPYDFYGVDEAEGIEAIPTPGTIGGPMGLAKAGFVSDLFTKYFVTAINGTETQAAAFQIALWEVVYEGPGDDGGIGTLDLDGGAFTVGGSGDGDREDAIDLANQWLATLVDNGISDDMLGMGSATFQDQLTLLVVPIPGALALGLIGMGGVATMRRRLRG
ncbi:MAG: hypothetical protein AB8G96_10680 [Phycisphaerales bacterium]